MMKHIFSIVMLIGLSSCVLQGDPKYQALNMAVTKCDDMMMWGAHVGDELGAKCLQVKLELIDYLLEQAKK